MRAGVEDSKQFLGGQPGLGVERIVVDHQVESRGAVERLEELEHHGKRVGKVVGAGDQSRARAQLLGTPRQLRHLIEVGVGQPYDDALARRGVADRELHQLQPLLERQRHRFAAAPAERTAVELREEVVEQAQEALKINLALVEGGGNDRQGAAQFQAEAFLIENWPGGWRTAPALAY